MSLNLSTIESLFGLVKYCFWSGEATAGVSRPVTIRVVFAQPTALQPRHVIHTSLARKRTGDAEIGWRPTPEKKIETMPCWGKK